MPTMTVIFDLDGTLIDSAPGILECFARVLSEHGIKPSTVLDRSLIGPPLAETFHRLAGPSPPELIDRMIIDFKLDYDSNGLLKTPAYPDVPKLLDTLHAAGIAMHIATNKRLAPSRTILQHLGLAGYFTSINALDMATPLISNKATLIAEMMPRHNMVPSTTLYVGDKMEDGYAAEANGVRFYAARWGYGVFPPKDTFTNWLQADSPTDLMLQILAASG